jgi:hypothetical protein
VLTAAGCRASAAERIAGHYTEAECQALAQQARERSRNGQSSAPLWKIATQGAWEVDLAPPPPDPGERAYAQSQALLDEVDAWRRQTDQQQEETAQALEAAKARLPWQQADTP